MAFASEISGPNLEGRWNRTKFKYDAFGYRVRSVTAGGDRRYFLDGQHLDTVVDPQGNPQSKYLRGTVIDEVVNAYHFDANGNATSYTYHHDALQSVVGLSGHAGSVEETYRYGPFGDLLSAPGTTPNRMQFTGREFDSETGLYYYRARYYDPEIGRFLSEDPLGFGGGDLNLYAYVQSNPIISNDPRGMSGRKLVSRLGEIVTDVTGRLRRYDGAKPTYVENAAHVAGRGLRPGKTPLPDDAHEVYKRAVPDDPDVPENWFGMNADGQIYRFSSSNDGTVHFSGIEGVGDGVRNITDYARARLNATSKGAVGRVLGTVGSVLTGIAAWIYSEPVEAAQDFILPFSPDDLRDAFIAGETGGCDGSGQCRSMIIYPSDDGLVATKPKP